MLKEILENVKNKAPLIHNITNYVTINDCANILLACGSSPIMADDPMEVEEITSISNGLVINIGTLHSHTIDAMRKAGKTANTHNLPVILDPVGVGSSRFRMETVQKLLKEVRFTVIRGNITEIKAISNGKRDTNGVDALITDKVTDDTMEEAVNYARILSRETGAIIAMTGGIDIISDSKKTYVVRNGNPMMGKISGTGCMLTSVIAAFCAANPERLLDATVAAVSSMGLCGEIAYEKTLQMNGGTSSFKMYLIDCMSNFTDKRLASGAKIEEIKNFGNKTLLQKLKGDNKRNISKHSMLLYAITDSIQLRDYCLAAQVEQAIQGGATCIQLREKNLSFHEYVKIAKEAKQITDQYQVPFIINDNIEVAIAVNADGVHIGQDDESIHIARKKLGVHKIIGLSAHTVAEAMNAQNSGADYIGVGAIFQTRTKNNTIPLSLETLKAITQAVHIPVVAIGGITKDNIEKLSGSGVDGIAVVSALFSQPDIAKAAKELKLLSMKMIDKKPFDATGAAYEPDFHEA